MAKVVTLCYRREESWSSGEQARAVVVLLKEGCEVVGSEAACRAKFVLQVFHLSYFTSLI